MPTKPCFGILVFVDGSLPKRLISPGVRNLVLRHRVPSRARVMFSRAVFQETESLAASHESSSVTVSAVLFIAKVNSVRKMTRNAPAEMVVRVGNENFPVLEASRSVHPEISMSFSLVFSSSMNSPRDSSPVGFASTSERRIR